MEALADNAVSAPRELPQHAHQALRLRRTRGAAVMVARANADAGVVVSSGAGNVVARLVSGVSDRSVLCQHGTAGVAMRTPDETATPWPPHALVVMFSDGIESRWKGEELSPLLGRDPALAAALLVRDHCRGHDDTTVAVLRRRD